MFEILEHTADIGFRAGGPSLEAVFEAAAEALLSIACEPKGIEPRERYHVTATGEDLESLLVNWLSEVLYLIDGRCLALARFRVMRLAADAVEAEVWGEPRDPARHRARLTIKGITYHQLRVFQSAGGWWCDVFVDV